ncbi:hypothetical protein IFM89_017747 [Coptis chinensis]|uniref:non-specific serine/threonine protein kinase n=1 Tax=Coptis chinensis TaxID=261450 RepID=A0A835LS15_9MAGN|nr:hypothetical protein IFM89_017747 [Coptis chinensis]
MATTFKALIYLSLFYSVFILRTTNALQETDILITFKTSIEDPLNSLSTWSKNSNTHICNWTGVTCSSSTTFSHSVISLNLQGLNLSGEISPSLCQLSSLSHLNLADNLFNQPIPLHLSQCNGLETLNLSYNLIWGTIPDQISLFSSLKVLDMSWNHIEGVIPNNLGFLQSLQVLNLGNNLFSGKVPSSIFGNLSKLVVLDLSQNPFLMSEIPEEIGKLQKLEQLLLQRSNFHGYVPESFVGLQGLKVLDLSQNNLTGEIPLKLGLSLENVVSFDVSQNRISGAFPIGICTSRSLINLNFHTNFFDGSIPDTFDPCLSLERFQVQNNGFSGDFPNGVWSLPKLKLIRAENNMFIGEIPDSIFKAVQLEQVQIDNNSFTGKVPNGLGLLKSLYRFSASLNASFMEGNQDLCGPGLPHSCADERSHPASIHLNKLIFTLIVVAFAAGIVLVAVGFFIMHRSSSYLKRNFSSGDWNMMLFYPLRITVQELLMGMNEKSAVSDHEGTFGRVHVMKLPSGEFFAVKKIMNSGFLSSKCLRAEIKTLAKIRHRNLTKLLGFCYSDDSIILIYEFVHSGSLKDSICNLEWRVRLRIALGAAQGLAYLHKDNVPRLLHGNFKSSNILLDMDCEPKLTEFSLYRIIGEKAYQSSIASESCYHIAPGIYVFFSTSYSLMISVFCSSVCSIVFL